MRIWIEWININRKERKILIYLKSSVTLLQSWDIGDFASILCHSVDRITQNYDDMLINQEINII